MGEHIFVIFGGTGDLAKRKLAPAFAHLSSSGILSSGSALIGVARGEYTDESYKKLLLNSTAKSSEKVEIENLDVRFFRADASNAKEISGLSSLIKSVNKPNAKVIFYLATSFKLFSPILKTIKEQGLNKNAVIIFEKPFGHDLQSAKKLEEEVGEVFDQKSIFRIDHYLAKETVQNIRTLKFDNLLFEGLLNKEFVESIEVLVNEDIGVADRLGYYHESGAIKDMIQNHLLQVLSLVLMDSPRKSSWSNEKHLVLKNIHFSKHEKNILGQYQSYREELEKSEIPYSEKETFARLHFQSQSDRWKGVKFILQTGKKLESKISRITIYFKKIQGLQQNKIVIDIYPKQDIMIYFNTRDPKTGQPTEASFDFCHECLFGPNTVDEYAFLLEEALKDNHEFFPNAEEILESWRIIEEIDTSNIQFAIYLDKVSPIR